MIAHQTRSPITIMARMLSVSKAGFRAQRPQPSSAHPTTDAALLNRVRDIRASSLETYSPSRNGCYV
jgi:putative transposase